MQLLLNPSLICLQLRCIMICPQVCQSTMMSCWIDSPALLLTPLKVSLFSNHMWRAQQDILNFLSWDAPAVAQIGKIVPCSACQIAHVFCHPCVTCHLLVHVNRLLSNGAVSLVHKKCLRSVDGYQHQSNPRHLSCTLQTNCLQRLCSGKMIWRPVLVSFARFRCRSFNKQKSP